MENPVLKYQQLDKAALVHLLERRDAQQPLGLVDH